MDLFQLAIDGDNHDVVESRVAGAYLVLEEFGVEFVLAESQGSGLPVDVTHFFFTFFTV